MYDLYYLRKKLFNLVISQDPSRKTNSHYDNPYTSNIVIVMDSVKNTYIQSTERKNSQQHKIFFYFTF